MAKRKEEMPSPGAPAWMATFGDLMNLLLCFYVLLFSMSSISEEKLKAVAESMSATFSIFSAGSTSIGDGILISNGVSQLNELGEYINSTGKQAESEVDSDELNEYEKMAEALEKEQLTKSEELAEKIEETIQENNLQDQIDVEFTSQFVQLTLNGAILYDSGRAELKKEAEPILSKVGLILEKYAESTIEIEGHTDNVPMHSATFPSNNELSTARAMAVFYYLTENTNLQASNIKHSGRGEYVPIADNSTEEGRSKNRRVEIRLYHSPLTY